MNNVEIEITNKEFKKLQQENERLNKLIETLFKENWKSNVDEKLELEWELFKHKNNIKPKIKINE